MDFGVSERVVEIRNLVREFMKREVYPLERPLRAKGFRALLPQLAQARERAQQTGLWAAFLPVDVGGGGLSLVEFAHLSEELGRSPLGHYVFNCQAPDVGNMEILREFGTPEQKERFLRPLVRGEVRSCFAMTEPERAGSNPLWLATTAKEEAGEAAGEDGDAWVLRGHKWFTTGADGAAFAVVMAVTDPDADRYGRASMILVPTDTPGWELVGNLSVMGERGEDYATHGEVALHGARVPQANLLGPRGAGFVIAQERLGPGRIHHCMRWIGICERAFQLMCERAATRELAPGKPLGTRQLVQAAIAESRADIDGARLLVLQAAWTIDREGTYAARQEISLIKFTVARVLQRVLDRALQVLGGWGMTDDTPVAYWYAHERAARIYDGPDEVHVTLVARRILRQYGLKLEG
jgi:alkylation response protein AidB-like acyl-CoA dehydrogenase